MILLLMGVAGSGKTTVGQILAQKLNWQFADADDYHSPENIAKMAAGVSLTDDDRAPWLAALASALKNWIAQHTNIVLACSALKENYRAQLLSDPAVKLVYLKGTYELILSRLQSRGYHYMRPAMLRSQFETLEEPHSAIIVSIDATPEAIADEIIAKLQVTSGTEVSR